MKAFRWNKSNYISSQGLTSLGWLWPGHLESGSPGACLAPAHPSCQQPQKRWCHDNHPGDGWELNRSYTFIYIIETYHGWHMGYSIYIYIWGIPKFFRSYTIWRFSFYCFWVFKHVLMQSSCAMHVSHDTSIHGSALILIDHLFWNFVSMHACRLKQEQFGSPSMAAH